MARCSLTLTGAPQGICRKPEIAIFPLRFLSCSLEYRNHQHRDLGQLRHITRGGSEQLSAQRRVSVRTHYYQISFHFNGLLDNCFRGSSADDFHSRDEFTVRGTLCQCIIAKSVQSLLHSCKSCRHSISKNLLRINLRHVNTDSKLHPGTEWFRYMQHNNASPVFLGHFESKTENRMHVIAQVSGVEYGLDFWIHNFALSSYLRTISGVCASPMFTCLVMISAPMRAHRTGAPPAAARRY